MIPVHYLSLPLGITSSLLLLPGPDNVFTHWGDRADDWIAKKNLKFLGPRFRAVFFTIQKPEKFPSRGDNGCGAGRFLYVERGVRL